VGIEACATSHHWAREIAKLGHEVRLMPARYVKPYVKRNKNDAADAEAICEAVTRPTMRFVAVKTEEQQSVLMLHRTRQLFVRQRTTLISAIRAHMAEFGIVAGVGRNGVERLLRLIDEGSDERVPPVARECLQALRAQLVLVKRQILEADRRILAWHRSNELSRRLETIPGVGPLIATALVASIPDPPMPSARHAMYRHGSGWCPSRTRRAARSGWEASQRPATAICAHCSWSGPYR
jgi:transposase